MARVSKSPSLSERASQIAARLSTTVHTEFASWLIATQQLTFLRIERDTVKGYRAVFVFEDPESRLEGLFLCFIRGEAAAADVSRVFDSKRMLLEMLRAGGYRGR